MGVISKKLASRFRKAKRQLGELRRQATADFAPVPKDVKIDLEPQGWLPRLLSNWMDFSKRHAFSRPWATIYSYAVKLSRLQARCTLPVDGEVFGGPAAWREGER